MAALGGNKWIPSFVYHIGDRLGILLGQRDNLTPPSRIFTDPDRIDGSRNVREFISIGEATVPWLISCGIAPTHKVLEMGCGIGRMAIPLTRYLHESGSYEGIDITAEKIHYCRHSISRTFPHFRFLHANIYNKYYNPRGKLRAAQYTFPYDNHTFDFIFLTSVFTHLLPDDMEHYVKEIARVLVPGGKCMGSFFLLDTLVGCPHHPHSDVCAIANQEEPEQGVYYEEGYVRACYAKSGLAIELLRYGTWSGRKEAHPDSPQDIIVAVKPRAPEQGQAVA